MPKFVVRGHYSGPSCFVVSVVRLGNRKNSRQQEAEPSHVSSYDLGRRKAAAITESRCCGVVTVLRCAASPHIICVCVFSSHSLWTSSSLDVPAGVTQEEGHTGFLIHLLSAVRALIFLARRIQPFLSLVDREVEFCVLTI